MAVNAVPFFAPVDLKQNELRNAIVQNLGTAPSSPISGQVYYDTGSNAVLWYNGASWINPLSRSNHTGTQLAATISDFDTQVRTSRLDQMAAPTGSVSMNSQLLTNVASPVSATDAANKAYVDANIQGVTTKPSAKYTTTTTLPAYTYANGTSGVGATITGNSNGALTNQDGQSVSANDIILVKNETSTNQPYNGLYTVTQVGDASHPYILTRHVDMDSSAEFQGALIAVETGSTLAGSLWLCSNTSAVTVGTTNVTFTQLNSAAGYTAGNGINIAGSTISAKAGTGITVTSGGINADTTVLAQKYSTTIGDGSTTSFTITHSLGTQDVLIQVRQAASPYQVVYTDCEATSTTQATIQFSSAPTSNQYRVTVIG